MMNLTSPSRFHSCHYISTINLQRIIDGHVQWMQTFMEEGWDGYLVSILFQPIAGPRKTKLIQMNQEVERIYNRLATRMVRIPQSSKWAGLLPMGTFVPDFPVPKRRTGHKSTIEDVSINDGLHMGGVVLANKWGRIRSDLAEHFAENKDIYEAGKVCSLNIKPITHDLRIAVDYTFKSLKRRICSLDDVLVLNWGGTGPHSEATRRWIQRTGSF